MAYRRSLSIRDRLFNQQRFGPSFSYIHHQNDGEKSNSLDELSNSNNFILCRSFGSTLGGLNTLFQDRGCSKLGNLMINGPFCVRHMSTTTDVAVVLSDKTVEEVASQAPAVSEVAAAAADSYFPVAGLQYLIDSIHNLTGLPWWGSIAVTTVVIRGMTVPLMINQLKATSKLTLMRPKLEEIKQEMEGGGMSPTAVAEGRERMSKIFREYGVTPFTPLKGLLIQGPVFISFFLAIQNMVEKVPSFKEGGAFWFTDLTTPDSFYVLPVLTALSFWITVECNMQEGLEGNPAAGTMKKVSRVFAVLAVPLTVSFPKALFCYWITSNMFSLVYGLVLKAPGVKGFLGVPNIPVLPTTTAQEPAFSFSEVRKKYEKHVQAQQQLAASSKPPSVPMDPSKPEDQSIPSSSSVLSQRIRSLEDEVEGRKKCENE